MNQTRGMRNKNPFNIRRSKYTWLGKVPFSLSTDKEFEQFKELDLGLRAGVVLFRTYIRKHCLTKPRLMIYRFAPQTENYINFYLANLRHFGIDVEKVISYPSDDFCKLLSAVCFIESRCIIHWMYFFSIIRKYNLY